MTDMTRKIEATMTEFEESVTFDADDPDFAPRGSERCLTIDSKTLDDNEKLDDLSRRMSATSMQTSSTENLNRKKSLSLTSCRNCDDACHQDHFEDSHPQYQDTTMLTIEELRAQLNSCFTCGVSWGEEHVSLDCRECGGYSLERPCPLCDGRCRNLWKRDLSVSHSSGKARWTGECGLSCGPALDESLVSAREKVRATS